MLLWAGFGGSCLTGVVCDPCSSTASCIRSTSVLHVRHQTAPEILVLERRGTVYGSASCRVLSHAFAGDSRIASDVYISRSLSAIVAVSAVDHHHRTIEAAKCKGYLDLPDGSSGRQI